jgi:hypothetical protein
MFRQVFRAWGLTFRESYLAWDAVPDLNLSRNHLGGVDEFYVRVLNSKHLEKPTEIPPFPTEFPENNGLRQHVIWAMGVFESLMRSPARIRPSPRPGTGPDHPRGPDRCLST